MSKSEMLSELERSGVLQSEKVRKAFEKIDRKDFLSTEYENYFYVNSPLPIGQGQTNSQPYTVALMLELLEVKEGQKILDIGSGSGWTTALLAELAGKKGEVIGVERVQELVEFGQKNLQKYHFNNAKIIAANSGELGIPQKKFDRILVSAAYHKIPEELVQQLEISGIMIIPVTSSIFKVRKLSEEETENSEFSGFNFVPLIK